MEDLIARTDSLVEAHIQDLEKAFADASVTIKSYFQDKTTSVKSLESVYYQGVQRLGVLGKAIESDGKRLRTQVDRVIAQSKELEVKEEEVVQVRASMEKHLQQYETATAELQEENRRYSQATTQLKDENQTLKTSNRTLQENIEQLSRELENVKHSLLQCEQSAKNAVSSMNADKEENKRLSASNSRLSKELKDFNTKIGQWKHSEEQSSRNIGVLEECIGTLLVGKQGLQQESNSREIIFRQCILSLTSQVNSLSTSVQAQDIKIDEISRSLPAEHAALLVLSQAPDKVYELQTVPNTTPGSTIQNPLKRSHGSSSPSRRTWYKMIDDIKDALQHLNPYHDNIDLIIARGQIMKHLSLPGCLASLSRYRKQPVNEKDGWRCLKVIINYGLSTAKPLEDDKMERCSYCKKDLSYYCVQVHPDGDGTCFRVISCNFEG